MKTAFLLVILCSSLLAAAPAKFHLDEAGRWSLPFRYWSSDTPFYAAGHYSFLAEVKELGPEILPIEKQQLPKRFRSGILKVEELLSPKLSGSPDLAKVRELSVEGLDGLKIGDKVIAFVDPDPYEGGYVINRHEGGCYVGIRLPPPGDDEFDAEQQGHILKTLREGRTSLRQLTSDELAAWINVDAAGIGLAFRMALDREELQWKAKPK